MSNITFDLFQDVQKIMQISEQEDRSSVASYKKVIEIAERMLKNPQIKELDGLEKVLDGNLFSLKGVFDLPSYVTEEQVFWLRKEKVRELFSGIRSILASQPRNTVWFYLAMPQEAYASSSFSG